MLVCLRIRDVEDRQRESWIVHVRHERLVREDVRLKYVVDSADVVHELPRKVANRGVKFLLRNKQLRTRRVGVRSMRGVIVDSHRSMMPCAACGLPTAWTG